MGLKCTRLPSLSLGVRVETRAVEVAEKSPAAEGAASGQDRAVSAKVPAAKGLAVVVVSAVGGDVRGRRGCPREKWCGHGGAAGTGRWGVDGGSLQQQNPDKRAGTQRCATVVGGMS